MNPKQDRPGARTPSDLERKYDFGEKFYNLNQTIEKQNLTIEQQNHIIEQQKLNIEKQEKSFSDYVALNNKVISDLQKSIAEFASSMGKVWQSVYPVGAIYISESSISPETLFGGTWVQIKDTFLLASGSTYKAGSTGGEATHTLTVKEMPRHIHRLAVRGGGNSDGGNSPFGAGKVFGYAGEYTFNAYSSSLVENTGGSKAHNNMPPYLAVYVWKRTK